MQIVLESCYFKNIEVLQACLCFFSMATWYLVTTIAFHLKNPHSNVDSLIKSNQQKIHFNTNSNFVLATFFFVSFPLFGIFLRVRCPPILVQTTICPIIIFVDISMKSLCQCSQGYQGDSNSKNSFRLGALNADAARINTMMGCGKAPLQDAHRHM